MTSVVSWAAVSLFRGVKRRKRFGLIHLLARSCIYQNLSWHSSQKTQDMKIHVLCLFSWPVCTGDVAGTQLYISHDRLHNEFVFVGVRHLSVWRFDTLGFQHSGVAAVCDRDFLGGCCQRASGPHSLPPGPAWNREYPPSPRHNVSSYRVENTSLFAST